MKIKTPTIIHIENISNKIVNYEPKGQNFIISIKPNHSYEFKLNRSEDVLYYLKQSSKDLLLVEQIKEFSKKDTTIAIDLPATITIKNISSKSINFVMYKENFTTQILPNDSIELTVKMAEEALYYLEQAIPNVLEVSYEKPISAKIFKYNVIPNSNFIAITGYDKSCPVEIKNGPTLEIPSTYDGYEVVSIIGDAFNGNSAQSIIIADNVRYIDDGAFKYMKILTKVEFGKDIEDISDTAFKGGRNLLTFIFHTPTPINKNNHSSHWVGEFLPVAIYVPDEGVEAWKEYARNLTTNKTEIESRIKPLSEYTE